MAVIWIYNPNKQFLKRKTLPRISEQWGKKTQNQAIFFQNSFTWPGKSTAERGCTKKHLGKIRFKRTAPLKKSLLWKDACLTFLKAEVFLHLRGAIWQAETTAFLLQLCWCQGGVSPCAAVYVSSIFYNGLAKCLVPIDSAAQAAALWLVNRGLGGFCCFAGLS